MAALTSSPVVLPRPAADPPASPQQLPSSAPSIVQHCPPSAVARSLTHSLRPSCSPQSQTCQHDRAQASSSTSASLYSSSHHNNNFDLDGGGRGGAPTEDSAVSRKGCLWIKEIDSLAHLVRQFPVLCHGMPPHHRHRCRRRMTTGHPSLGDRIGCMAGLAAYIQEGRLRSSHDSDFFLFLHPTVFDGLALITLFFLYLIIYSSCPN